MKTKRHSHPKSPLLQNEGEGSYTAARRYDEGVRHSEEKGNAEHLAQEAKRALEGPEGDELRRADTFGKAGKPHHHERRPKPTGAP